LQIDVVGVHIYTERNCGNKCKGNFKETIITMVIPKRMTAKMEGSWKMHNWLPVFLAMPRMLTELRRQPDRRTCLVWQNDIASSILAILWGPHSICEEL
jgi:hypothetical protein